MNTKYMNKCCLRTAFVSSRPNWTVYRKFEYVDLRIFGTTTNRILFTCKIVVERQGKGGSLFTC